MTSLTSYVSVFVGKSECALRRIRPDQVAQCSKPLLVLFQVQLILINCRLLMAFVLRAAQVAEMNSGAFFKSQLEEEAFG